MGGGAEKGRLAGLEELIRRVGRNERIGHGQVGDGTGGAAESIADDHVIAPGIKALNACEYKGGIGCSRNKRSVFAPLVNEGLSAGGDDAEADTGAATH